MSATAGARLRAGRRQRLRRSAHCYGCDSRSPGHSLLASPRQSAAGLPGVNDVRQTERQTDRQRAGSTCNPILKRQPITSAGASRWGHSLAESQGEGHWGPFRRLSNPRPVSLPKGASQEGCSPQGSGEQRRSSLAHLGGARVCQQRGRGCWCLERIRQLQELWWGAIPAPLPLHFPGVSWADSYSRLHTCDLLSLVGPPALAPRQADWALTPRSRQVL